MNAWWLLGGFLAYKWIKPEKTTMQVKVGIYRDAKGKIFYIPEE